jgi:hypothetical protein
VAADVTILAAGVEGVPASYTVPPLQEILLKSVHAVIDGTGASGDFVPVLEIVSDAGIVNARCVGSTVTAGASVDASWFPHVAAAAASSTGLPWCYGVSAGFGPVGPGTASHTVDLSGGIVTNDASLFGTGPNTSDGVDGLTISGPGMYEFRMVWGPFDSIPAGDYAAVPGFTSSSPLSSLTSYEAPNTPRIAVSGDSGNRQFATLVFCGEITSGGTSANAAITMAVEWSFTGSTLVNPLEFVCKRIGDAS